MPSRRPRRIARRCTLVRVITRPSTSTSSCASGSISRPQTASICRGSTAPRDLRADLGDRAFGAPTEIGDEGADGAALLLQRVHVALRYVELDPTDPPGLSLALRGRRERKDTIKSDIGGRKTIMRSICQYFLLSDLERMPSQADTRGIHVAVSDQPSP